ncbi:MAG TPA: condensation domain-containing protein [Streptosporangiaceae bacterium]
MSFHGERAASGPLTLGQLNVLLWAQGETAGGAVLCQDVDVAGRSLDEVTTAIGQLVGRHESLRTRFAVNSSGEWKQLVSASGELLAEICAADDLPGSTVALALDSMRQRLGGKPFTLDSEWPLRVAVITSGGAPVKVLLAVTHMVADFASLGIVAREIGQLLAFGSGQALEPATCQPLDQAELEAAPSRKRRAETALRHWESVLRSTPQCMFAVPERTAPADPPQLAVMYSRAASIALAGIAERTQASQSSAIVAAIATLLGIYTANDRCQITAICANRFSPASRDFVGTIAQDAIVALDLNAGTFDEVIRGSRGATLTAYRCAQYDAAKLWATIDQVNEDRGTKFHRDCILNDVFIVDSPAMSAQMDVSGRAPAPGDTVSAMRDTELIWVDVEPWPVLFYFVVRKMGERDVGLSLWADPLRMPRAEVERFLRGIERLLVAAAQRDIPVGEVSELTGIEPVSRDPAWLRIDRCWVELPAVQRLVDDAVAAVSGLGAGRVFSVRDADGAETLVAYAAIPGGAGPERLHAECMQRLPGRFTAMTPARYVICDRLPEDPDRIESWQRLPFLAEGSGRSPASVLATVGGAVKAGAGN